MKKTSALISAILIFGIINNVSGQCTVTISPQDPTICAGDTVNLHASVIGTNALTTTFVGGNNHRGNMFDISATNDVVINSFDANPEGNTTIVIYYKVGSYSGSESNPAAWTFIDSVPIISNGTGNPTPIPIDINVTIPAGQTYAFYVSSTNLNVNLNYTNGTSVGSAFASDANITFYEGIGLEYPFGGNYSPRVWNGIIRYTLASDPVSYMWSNGDTTQTTIVTPATPIQYLVSVSTAGCGAMVDTVDIFISTPVVDAGINDTICYGDSILLLASGTGIDTLMWSGGIPDSSYVIPAGSNTYYVTAYDSIGCTAMDSVYYQVNTIDTSVSVTGATLTSNQANAMYQWIDCNTTFDITGETNQSFTATVNGSYAVSITDSIGCTGVSPCIDINNIRILDYETELIKAFPNPTQDKCIIQSEELMQIISVYNIDGQLILNETPNSLEYIIDLNEFSSGLYILSVQTSNGIDNLILEKN